MAFDAKTVALDDVEKLTIDQCREVVAVHDGPDLPKTIKADDARKYARAFVQASLPAPAATNGDHADTMPLEDPPSSVIPSEKRFEYVVRLGQWLAESSLVPEVLKKKPQDVVAVLLRANDLGIPLTQGIDQLYVIKGKVGMEGKLMRALVRKAGHSIRDVTREADSDDGWDRWTVIGKRCDGMEDDQTVTYTLDDAVDAGLIRSFDRDRNTGRAVVKASDGKDQWRKMPRTMCKWRATSELCRDLFSDCLAGVAYTPEELDLGEYVDGAPEAGRARGAADDGEVPLTDAQQRDLLASRIAALEPDLVAEVKAEWRRRNLPSLVRQGQSDKPLIHGAALGQAIKIVAAAEAKQAEREDVDDVDEADVVPSCGICGTTDEAAIATGADGGVRCTDTEACMARVSEAARAKAEMERPFTDDPAPPGEAPPVGMCNEAGGCPNVAVADGYCADHQPM